MRARTAEERLESETLVNLARIGWGRDNPAFRQVFTSQFIPDGTAEQFRAFNELQRISASPTHAVRSIEVSNTIDVTALAPQVRCPTLVLHARHDARIPYEEGRLLASLVPGARFVTLESRNHVLFEGEQAFGQFVTELDTFLPRTAARLPELTPRERELLELLARGLDNHQMAAHLGVAEKTVRNHVSAILAKLWADSRGRAIVLAREAGFGTATA